MIHPTERQTLLITGGNGLLGTKLLELCLRDASIHPVSVSRQPCSNRFLGPFDFYQADLTDPGAVAEVFERVRPAVVVHTAAMTDVDGCERDPEQAWRLNVEGSEHVARSAAALGSLLVHLSTEYVFDGRAGPYSETDLTNPISVYGRTKLESERVVGTHCPTAAIARTTILYGHAPNVRPNFVIWLVGQLRSGKPVRIVDDQVGSPTLADNLAEMCLALRRGRGIYNTVGADRVDRFRFALLVAEVFELDPAPISPVSTASLGQPAPRPLRAGLRMDRFQREFPDVAVRDARRGLAVVRTQLDRQPS
jgi:dTDP-4-dehydrorhamnose reductase